MVEDGVDSYVAYDEAVADDWVVVHVVVYEEDAADDCGHVVYEEDTADDCSHVAHETELAVPYDCTLMLGTFDTKQEG